MAGPDFEPSEAKKKERRVMNVVEEQTTEDAMEEAVEDAVEETIEDSANEGDSAPPKDSPGQPAPGELEPEGPAFEQGPEPS